MSTIILPGVPLYILKEKARKDAKYVQLFYKAMIQFIAQTLS